MHNKIAALHVLATQQSTSPNELFEHFNEAYEEDKKSTIQMMMFIRDKNN
jgi:hypothetical protein